LKAAGTGGDRATWSGRSRYLTRDVRVVGGVGTIVTILLVGLAAPWITSRDPREQVLSEALSAPSTRHLFGTDQFGRDILSRIVYGARISLWVGLISVGFACATGIPLGLLSGYYAGAVDDVISRITDVMLGLPAVLLALAVMAILGPSIRSVIFAVGISLLPEYVRTVRSSTLSLKVQDYVSASQALGASDRQEPPTGRSYTATSCRTDCLHWWSSPRSNSRARSCSQLA
jgi:peptide/nickel transport system permease protein